MSSENKIINNISWHLEHKAQSVFEFDLYGLGSCHYTSPRSDYKFEYSASVIVLNMMDIVELDGNVYWTDTSRKKNAHLVATGHSSSYR